MICREDFFARARTVSLCDTTEQLYAAYETFLTCPLSPFRVEQDALAVDCARCGNCCRRPWRVEVHPRDLLRWAAEGRHDIIASLEHRPRGFERGTEVPSNLLRELASLLAGADEALLARALAIARGAEISPGSYVLPKKRGCYYLIDGVTTACRIYDTRPEVCQRFPDVD